MCFLLPFFFFFKQLSVQHFVSCNRIHFRVSKYYLLFFCFHAFGTTSSRGLESPHQILSLSTVVLLQNICSPPPLPTCSSLELLCGTSCHCKMYLPLVAIFWLYQNHFFFFNLYPCWTVSPLRAVLLISKSPAPGTQPCKKPWVNEWISSFIQQMLTDCFL